MIAGDSIDGANDLCVLKCDVSKCSITFNT